MVQKLRRYRSDWDLTRCGWFEAGGYRSQWYCGLSAGMEWLRLSLETAEGAVIRVYAQDGEPEGWNAGMEPALERSSRDLLLYGVRGQYLCFTVTPAQDLRGYVLEFPGLSIDAQLPAVMHGDNTLRRLLGVYQSLFMDTNRAFAAFPARLDPLGTDPLPELPLWLGAGRWMRGALPNGKLLAAAPRLNRMRGTRKGLELLAELVAGCGCTVVERFQWSGQSLPAWEREECARLYGGAHAGAALLLPAQADGETVRVLKDILEDFIPLGVSCAIIQMTDAALLDGHSYLDAGARIGVQADGDEADEEGTLILE